MRKMLRLGVLLLVGTIVTILCSCQNWQHHGSDNYDVADSMQVAQFVESVQNPDLMSVSEILELQKQMQEISSVDSAFVAMPQDVMRNVSTVLLKKRKYVRKKDIVEEFRHNADIYNNLPKSPDTTQNSVKQFAPLTVDKTGTDLGSRQNGKVFATYYKYRTDTIDGKPVKIQIKTEESYE